MNIQNIQNVEENTSQGGVNCMINRVAGDQATMSYSKNPSDL